MTQNNKLLLIVWHKCFGYFNFSTLRKHLARYNIHHIKNKRVCNSYERAKVTKYYNYMPQNRAKRAYQFIHTDLVRPITPMQFRAKTYFFMFTYKHTCITEMTTGRQ